MIWVINHLSIIVFSLFFWIVIIFCSVNTDFSGALRSYEVTGKHVKLPRFYTGCRHLLSPAFIDPSGGQLPPSSHPEYREPPCMPPIIWLPTKTCLSFVGSCTVDVVGPDSGSCSPRVTNSLIKITRIIIIIIIVFYTYAAGIKLALFNPFFSIQGEKKYFFVCFSRCRLSSVSKIGFIIDIGVCTYTINYMYWF